MRQDPSDGTLKPFDFSQILAEVPELGKFAVRIDTYTFDPSTPQTWSPRSGNPSPVSSRTSMTCTTAL